MTCGAVALCHAAQHFGLFGYPAPESVCRLHDWLLNTPLTGFLHGGGLTAEQHSELENLLSI